MHADILPLIIITPPDHVRNAVIAREWAYLILAVYQSALGKLAAQIGETQIFAVAKE